jgi:hypothetical protein
MVNAKAKPTTKRSPRGRKPVRGADRILLSLREYSAHRRNLGLPGSVFAIQAALKSGKISRTCADHERCPPACKQAKINPHVADLEWDAWTDPTHSASDVQPATIVEAQLQRLTWQARLDRQKFDERAGFLVHTDEVRSVAFRVNRNVRDGLLMIPRRVAGRIVTLTDRKKVEAVIDKEIRDVLKAFDRDALAKRG